MGTTNKKLQKKQTEILLATLQNRFEKNMTRHHGLDWTKVQEKLLKQTAKLWSLHEMESTGGEPDVISYDKKNDSYVFMDCSAESPKGRRSLCYDREGLESRKEFKPKDNVIDVAKAMGVELLSEEQYKFLQQHGKFDSKTSSWLQTPPSIRKLGGALFGDHRYGQVFIYHNGAQSYYESRGFRSVLYV